ncbi:ATP-binding protein [Streptomyces sp. VRA16 Mangrove soil]|uniref:ATP-binding protein n=1 Tax=Streptomyces sp. VRA16 Mangrove soil TaxID=2817434 RepID=UPI001A9D1690|nr:ATP-binding protein [Streptomyces sp. VRA16 Mangrove soil]MBO1337133.1 ATP-binding protein [Streptomyces sp. VRA16 Mangrove soil]
MNGSMNPTEPKRFTILLSATARGARLARLLAERQLAEWKRESPEAEHVVAELAANAVRHGRVPGRDFRLTLTLDAARTLRIEVADARPDRVPRFREADDEGGRGLLIVAAYADRWGVTGGETAAPHKTVWAELDAPEGELRTSGRAAP